MVRAIVLGPPGSGKGTQASLLASKAGATHVSVGDLVRTEVENGSQIGRRVAATVAAGDLVADEDVIAVLAAPLEAATRAGGWVLDGIPRTVDQATALDDMLAEMDASPQLIVALEVTADEVAERLRARAPVEHRVDDTEAVVAHRLAVWAREGPPVLAWYERQKRLTRIDGSGDAATVADRLAAAAERAPH
ncbi:MAG TPA: nucleoside monophosphate kinase [Actinomycetota bacterium]|nr:nucleoside monophosphate kinase [Actinomycetota bacterium]